MAFIHWWIFPSSNGESEHVRSEFRTWPKLVQSVLCACGTGFNGEIVFTYKATLGKSMSVSVVRHVLHYCRVTQCLQILKFTWNSTLNLTLVSQPTRPHTEKHIQYDDKAGHTGIYTYSIHTHTPTNTHLKVEQSVQLVLNNGQSFDQLLCIHGAHHSINTAQRTNTYINKQQQTHRNEHNQQPKVPKKIK